MSDGIAYQNKDIEFKLISETFKEKSFEALIFFYWKMIRLQLWTMKRKIS